MHLVGVKDDDWWLYSRWELTFPVGWDQITRGAALLYQYLDQPEVLVEDNPVNIGDKEEIKAIPENRSMIVRGMSDSLKAPIMVTFYNQLQIVDANIAKATDEFKNTDYEKFNHSLCQFMDSIELEMHRK